MDWALVDGVADRASCPRDVDSMATRSILARLPEDCHDEFLNLIQEACTKNARRRLCITRPDQPLLVVDILPLSIENGDRNPALVVLNDSSEMDSSYERFKRLARRNEAILLSAMDGFFVVDEHCRFLEVNDAFCRMTGYSSAELLQMHITDLEVDAHENGGVPSHTRTGLHHFPTAHRHKDGYLIHLEISVNVLHDNGSKILVGFARDVTERKRAEEELARLTRQQKLILDSAAEGIVGLSEDELIMFMNPAAAEMLGFNAAELTGRSAHEVFFKRAEHNGDSLPSKCPFCAAKDSNDAILRGDGEFMRRDGSSFPIEYSVTPMFDRSRKIGAVLVFRDVTERHRAAEQRRALEAQIQQAQRLESLGMLAGGIAHDLNNMLAGIQGNASLALSEVPDQTRVGERLKRIVGGCERAAKVIQQILAYSGQVTCTPGRVDLNEQIEEMTAFMRAAVPRTINFDVRLAPDLPMVEADSGQLQQVVTNLLVNAVEAIGEETGRITICTAHKFLEEADVRQEFTGQNLTPGQYVALIVEDTGCGMSSATMRRIFEPFFSKKGAGRGLGLAAMHGVIRAQRGGVRVESKPGQGSRFTVVFPAAQHEHKADDDKAGKPPIQLESTVLVIDDEDEVRDVIRDMLTYRGMNVLTAPDGPHGIEVFRENADRIDVILLDMTMPGMSGGEVFQRILDIRPDARVIISSGYSEERVSTRFGENKPAAFVHKPFTADTLMEGIASVLAQRRRIGDTIR